jgi:hypothetical protein
MKISVKNRTKYLLFMEKYISEEKSKHNSIDFGRKDIH